MADEKSREPNQPNDQERGKAMGAGATAGQGQSQQGSEHSPQQSETPGQGGGIQGSGQRQPNPGGFTEGEGGQRDEVRGNESSTGNREEPRGE